MAQAKRHVPGDRLPHAEWNDLLRRIIALERNQLKALANRVDINAPLVPFLYGASDGDVLVCLKLLPVFGGADSGGTENYYIAKPHTHRPSVTSRGSHTYSYSTDFQRIDTVGADAETQVLTPAYETGDVIYAVRCEPTTGVEYSPPSQATRPITWLQVNVDGRAWAQKFEEEE